MPPGSVCNVTTVPGVNRAVHDPLAAPADTAQSIPVGEEIMRPLPEPLPDTESATVGAAGSVTRDGVALSPPPPEQAESAVTATTAVRTCRATIAQRARVAWWKMRIAGQEWAPEISVAHDRHTISRSRPVTKSKCHARFSDA